MTSWADPLHPPLEPERIPVRTFTFLDDTGGAHRIEARNVTDAWVALSFREEAEVEELVERDWRVKFE